MVARARALLYNPPTQPRRQDLGRLLADAGLEVVEADTAARCLELAAPPPDLVLLRLPLAGLDRAEVYRALKANPATAAVLLLHLYPASATPGADLGFADAVLAEPDEPAELLSTVKLLLRLRRAEAPAAAEDTAEAPLEREMHVLERLPGTAQAPVTARLYGAGPLRETLPAIFAELVQTYAGLLDQALEQHQYRLAQDLAEPVRALAEQLGALRAGPRDVIDLHGAALQQKQQDSSRGRLRGFVSEGRLLLTELLGDLVSHYRRHALQAVEAPAPGPAEPRRER